MYKYKLLYMLGLFAHYSLRIDKFWKTKVNTDPSLGTLLTLISIP